MNQAELANENKALGWQIALGFQAKSRHQNQGWQIALGFQAKSCHQNQTMTMTKHQGPLLAGIVSCVTRVKRGGEMRYHRPITLKK